MKWALLNRRCAPLHLHIMLLFGLLLVTGGSLIGWYNYHQQTRLQLDSQRQLFQELTQSTAAQLQRLVEGPQILLDTLVQLRATAPALTQHYPWLPLLQRALGHLPQLDAVYLASPDGDFLLVRRLRTQAQRSFFDAPPGTTQMIQSVRQGGPAARFRFYDDQPALLAERTLPSFDFDPRNREWYRQALQSRELVVTPPYLFFSNRQPGITLARPAQDGLGVIGADITLETVSAILAQRRPSRSAELLIFTPELTLLSHNNMQLLTRRLQPGPDDLLKLPRLDELDLPLLTALARHYQRQPAGPIILHAGGYNWQGQLTGLSLDGYHPAVLAMLAPEAELFQQAHQLRSESLLLTIGLILLSLPIAWWSARRIATPLQRLMQESEAITTFHFAPAKAHRSAIQEIDRLTQSIAQMKQTIHHFMELSVSISAEPDFNALCQRLLDETLKLTRMELSGLWLKDNDHYRLISAQGKGDTQWLPREFTPATPASSHRLLPPLLKAITANYSQQIWLEDINGGLSLLVVPLCNRDGQRVGALALGQPRRIQLSREVIAFIEALSGMVIVSIENHQLLEAQKQLMASLIQLIAGAIDTKSPFTGAHCQRVPEITRLLAEAACETHEGPYAGFHLEPQQWEALHIAAWLHDCGKITTPEYVIGKATRLEALYDRINEIRMRFEVVKRDARIAYWQSRCKCGDSAGLRECLKAELKILDEEFAFVAACNQGSLKMHDANRQRLMQIAARRWQRTLDDNLGLGLEEQRRKQKYGSPKSLPAWECLLADKPEQRIPREHDEQIPPDNPWGFRMIPPPCKFNLGELYCLSFAEGTLTPEERYIINDHIVQTIIMLEQLPFPDYLKQVPQIAGAHHERPDGSGYPRGLTREQMPVTARMLAIADIFEALTAADRPYKRALTLTETLTIMQQMHREQKIDGDLFELFLRSGAYLKYARRFLKPEQIDLEAIEPFLSTDNVKSS